MKTMRQKTTPQEQVYAYHTKGLNAKEIGKLLGLSERTVQRYARQMNCKALKQPKTREVRALELHKEGFSYAEIAKKLRVCKATVYNWHRKAKSNNN